MEQNTLAYQSRTAFAARAFNQLHHYKRLFLKYSWIPLLFVGLCVGIQVILIKRAPPTFVSMGRMIVNVKLSIPDANVYSEELNNFYGTQVELMQSDSVVNRVNLELQSTHPELHRVPVKLIVTISPKTSIFNLQAVGADPFYTEAYLGEAMDEYIKLKKDLLANATTATQLGMEEELKQAALELQKGKEELLNYQSSNSVVFLQSDSGNSAADYLSSLTRQLAERKSELLLLQTLTLDQNLEREQGIFVQQSSTSQSNAVSQQISAPANQATESSPSDASQNNIPSTLGDFEDSYLKAKQQLILLKAKRDELGKTLTPTSTDMIALNQEIAYQEKLLDIFSEQSQEQLNNREYTLKVQIQDLQDQIKEWELKAVDVNTKLSNFESLKENQKRLQAIYDQIQANLQTLDMDKGINQESVTILEPPTTAVSVQPEIPKHLIMAGLIGLVLGIGILLSIDKLDDRINSSTELMQLFNLPVLGQIPAVKAKDKRAGVPILQLEDDRYTLIEAYRSLRSAFLYKDLLKSDPKDQPRSIVITSPNPHDGKSMTAANFAITLAQGGARVLLIDADLRRGMLAKHFSVAASPGLADVLAGQCGWATTVVQTTIPNLHVLPCGTLPRHSENLFAMAGKVLAEMTGHYDYYLFDTSPVMVADDVLSLAPHTDGLIMIIRAGFTSGRVAQAALDLLHLRHVGVIGLIFNAVHPNANDYYLYRFKEYYPQTTTT